MNLPSHDPALSYQETSHPGRRMLAWATAVFLAFAIANEAVDLEILSPWANIVIGLLLLTAVVLYFVGYWKAVRAKNRHPAWFLFSLTGPLGLGIILFLPQAEGVRA